jgi:hypothetical protein
MKAKRSEAIESGDKYYNTGKLCKHGHHSDRRTVDGACLMCIKVYQKNTREEIRKKILEKA